MKISIWGMNPERGQPMACALRGHGRHSVVGFGPYARESPDPQVRELMGIPVPLPIADRAEWALREGSDLAIVASSTPRATLAMISALAVEQGIQVPVIVVTPWALAPAWQPSPSLAVGYAPFEYRPERALDRLLNLRSIVVRAEQPGAIQVLHRAVSEAWSWVDNKIQIDVVWSGVR